MKKAFAACLIGILSCAVLGIHAWRTWDGMDRLPGLQQSDRELFEYSLFLESFTFMVSAAYFFGPRFYRVFGEEAAAVKFAGEKDRVSRLVHIYSAVAVILRRLSFDRQMGVSWAETLLMISLICAPVVLSLVQRNRASRAKAG